MQAERCMRWTGVDSITHLLLKEVLVEDVLDGPGQYFVLQEANIELAQRAVVFGHRLPVAEHGLHLCQWIVLRLSFHFFVRSAHGAVVARGASLLGLKGYSSR